MQEPMGWAIAPTQPILSVTAVKGALTRMVGAFLFWGLLRVGWMVSYWVTYKIGSVDFFGAA